jgi:NIMA (never in mitosis gene a)-related kinase
LKEELGSGGYGEVFEVEKESNKKRMAMKVMKISKENKKSSKAMEAEIRIGINLGSTCKFLVQLTEYFISDGFCCLIMEYCDGGDLEKVLEEKKRIPQNVY